MSGSIGKGCRQQSCPVHPQSITEGGLDPWRRHPSICFPNCRRGASPCSTVSPLPPRCSFRLSHARPLLYPPTALFTVNCRPSLTLQPQIVQLASLDQKIWSKLQFYRRKFDAALEEIILMCSSNEGVRGHLECFGEILKVVVVPDNGTSRSKGDGFEAEAAIRACLGPYPVIDSRRANRNLACLVVQRSKASQPTASASIAVIIGIASHWRISMMLGHCK